uniref:Uncharacterized protein n=1 Tax=Monopterus albus TaxID=43700 RepID=A0A3Q3IE48_MONAL
MCVFVWVCGCSEVSVMAVNIMTVCCRAYVLFLYLLHCFLHVLSQGEGFHQAPPAHSMFLRSRRANMFLLEEILQGNLERECYEELCNFEEAREYFEDTKKTIDFWVFYIDGDQCQPNPCLHGGNCTDKVGGFYCSCTSPHYGPVCEKGAPKNLKRPLPTPHVTWPGVPEITECPTEGPTACHQLCTASRNSFTCSCLPGFKLQSDKRTCLPQVEFPCGRLPGRFNNTASICHHGKCPWQVSLLNSKAVEVCGGVVLGQRTILTAAHCLLDSESNPSPSNFFVATGNDKILVPVQALYVHDRYRADHHDNDLALLELANPLPFSSALTHLCLPTKDFSENILMHSGRTGVVEQQGGRPNQDLVYMMLDECRIQLNVSHPLTNKMFCMRRQNGAQKSPDGQMGSQNDSEGRTNVLSGKRTEAQRQQSGPVWNHYGGKRLTEPLGNQNVAQRNLTQPPETQNGTQGGLDGHIMNRRQNQTQRSQTGTQGTPNGAENHKGSITQNGTKLRSEGSVRRCGGMLPGSPVATVEQGTAFLTGLMISSSAGCDGDDSLVFTKLSRYLNWIKLRLKVAEDRMSSRFSEHPENH